jgi:hypothetical protein
MLCCDWWTRGWTEVERVKKALWCKLCSAMPDRVCHCHVYIISVRVSLLSQYKALGWRNFSWWEARTGKNGALGCTILVPSLKTFQMWRWWRWVACTTLGTIVCLVERDLVSVTGCLLSYCWKSLYFSSHDEIAPIRLACPECIWKWNITIELLLDGTQCRASTPTNHMFLVPRAAGGVRKHFTRTQNQIYKRSNHQYKPKVVLFSLSKSIRQYCSWRHQSSGRSGRSGKRSSGVCHPDQSLERATHPLNAVQTMLAKGNSWSRPRRSVR